MRDNLEASPYTFTLSPVPNAIAENVNAAAPSNENSPPVPTDDKQKPSGVGRVTDANQRRGVLRGRLTDQFGGVIAGATVKAVDASGAEAETQTNAEGIYTFSNLAAGRYTLSASASGFAIFRDATVDIAQGQTATFDIKLIVTLEKQEVKVTSAEPRGINLVNNLSGMVLRGKDIDALPDGPGGLEAALRGLAVRTAGPNGPQIVVDGFTGNRLPPKNSIREIRINENPFSSEYDQLGFGRIEIFTKPGTEEFQFRGFTIFNDESLNSRNPFASTRAPYQARLYGASASGPIIPKRASFFLDFENQRIDDNALVNATVLDSSFNITPFNLTVLTPQRRANLNTRFDYQINQNNTLIARYNFLRSRSINSGIGNFSLPSRAYNSSDSAHTLQLTETAVLNPQAVNETRFQYLSSRRQQAGNDSIVTLDVPEAFIAGGSPVGNSLNREDRWELTNFTTYVFGNHILKTGGRVRGIEVVNDSTQNFGGTFTFAGGLAPQLDAANQIVRDSSGQPLNESITGIERYRRTLLFGQLGLPFAERIARGGGATQFSIAAGDPTARVSQFDIGAFAQDEWRIKPNLTLSLGLRYEAQTNIGDHTNLSPRIGFAWSPDANAEQPKTVIRGGVGTFYERFNESYTLQANRANGINQQQFIVSDARLLNSFPFAPSLDALAAFAVPQATFRVADKLRAPLTTQSSFSIERQLPYNFSLGATYVSTRTRNALRSRNINAPLRATFASSMAEVGVRPMDGVGDIFQYESNGVFNQHQLILNTVGSFKSNTTFWATYILSNAKSDTDGADNFPADSYNLAAEYGRSALDARHSFYFGGWFKAPWGIDVNPLIYARSSTPFNITTGRDQNGDTLFTERPALATDFTKPDVISTTLGTFDLNPTPGQPLIPRNFGRGANFVSVNVRASKTFNFSSNSAAETAIQPNATQSSPNGLRELLKRKFEDRNYSLTFSVQVENLFNRTNPGVPIGNLSSPSFGQSITSAGGYGFGTNSSGNRRVEFQLSFNF